MSDQTPAELRDALENAQKELKKLTKANSDLTAENRKLMAKEVFREADLSPNAADLFVAANPEADITVDAVVEFAKNYGIGNVEAADDGDDEGDGASGDGEGEGSGSDGTEGLSGFARAGSGQGGSGQPPTTGKTMTRDEFLTAQRDNPALAQKALAEGRVRLRPDNPLGQGATPTVGHNPFVRQGSDDE